MQNILFLGGSGFIGKNIVESFSEDRNCNLIVITRNSFLINDMLFLKPNITVLVGELEDFDFIEDLIIEHEVNVIIHMLSSLIPSSSDIHFYESINKIIVPTFKLIDFIADRNIKFLYFSSGGTIYGNTSSIIKESHLLNPINNYGLSKLMIENYINYKSNRSTLDFIIIRPSNVYGKHQSFNSNQGFISVAINKIYNNIPIEVWGDGNSVRDYIQVDDVVFFVRKLLSDFSHGSTTINLSTGIGKSLLDIIILIEKNTKKKAIIHFKNKRSVDANTIVLDNSKLLMIIPHDFISIDQGIKSQVNYFKKILNNAN